MVVQPRPHSFVFPIVLIIGGSLLLLACLGAISGAAGWRLLDMWPLLLIAIAPSSSSGPRSRVPPRAPWPWPWLSWTSTP